MPKTGRGAGVLVVAGRLVHVALHASCKGPTGTIAHAAVHCATGSAAPAHAVLHISCCVPAGNIAHIAHESPVTKFGVVGVVLVVTAFGVAFVPAVGGLVPAVAAFGVVVVTGFTILVVSAPPPLPPIPMMPANRTSILHDAAHVSLVDPHVVMQLHPVVQSDCIADGMTSQMSLQFASVGSPNSHIAWHVLFMVGGAIVHIMSQLG
jgi:hypothetical protein